jgi:hypothetical protein
VFSRRDGRAGYAFVLLKHARAGHDDSLLDALLNQRRTKNNGYLAKSALLAYGDDENGLCAASGALTASFSFARDSNRCALPPAHRSTFSDLHLLRHKKQLPPSPCEYVINVLDKGFPFVTKSSPLFGNF